MIESKKTVRTRIAPSPTGQLHIGHVRTSLYDYALAKKFGGKFVIRIEDTDKKRQIDGAIEKILELHEYIGLNWDEGPKVGGPYSPYIQSERLDIYKKYSQELIDSGHAYYCFCTEERLEKLKEEQKANGSPSTKYDKHCANLSKQEIEQYLKDGTSYVVRLNIPENEEIIWKDEVLGEIKVNTNDIDDQVLIKSDGFPTYHLAVVVDDHLMEITHVLRGNDWLPSTPKHVLLYKYFGWNLPLFIHLPNLKEVEGTKKLSKRYGAVALEDFIREGYVSEAILNYLMFLGWNPGTEKEIYSLEEFVKDFSVEKIQSNALVSFDRVRFMWINGHYIRNYPTEVLMEKLLDWSVSYDIKLNGTENGRFKDKNKILLILDLIKERMKVLSEFNLLTGYFFNEPAIDKELLISFTESEQRSNEIISNFLDFYNSISASDWNKEFLDVKSHELLAKYGYKPKEAFMSLRIAVTGDKATPPLFDVLAVLNKETVVNRLSKVLKI